MLLVIETAGGVVAAVHTRPSGTSKVYIVDWDDVLDGKLPTLPEGTRISKSLDLLMWDSSFPWSRLL